MLAPARGRSAAARPRRGSAAASALSAAAYSAQKLGAQNAWHRPLLTGKRRRASCAPCPAAKNGPRTGPSTPSTTAPRVANCSAPCHRAPPAQRRRSRCTKKAGAAYRKMCLAASAAANSAAPGSSRPRATAQVASTNRPSSTPLYWKWMWSTMTNPGCAATRKSASRRRARGRPAAACHVAHTSRPSLSSTLRRWKRTVASLA